MVALASLAVLLLIFNSAQAHSLFPYQQESYRNFRLENQRAITVSASTEDIQNAISKVNPSVVSIFGYKKILQNEEQQTISFPFFNISLTIPAQETEEVDAGTGFFVDSRGYIVTSEHVVDDPNADYKIILQDGTPQTATVLYKDAVNDIAILKIPGENYAPATLGDSSAVTKGEVVIATGNALGSMRNIPAVGSVTGLHKSIQPSNTGDNQQTINDLMQSNMQLYPGHSGGPTFDLSGTVVGINDAVAANQKNVSFSVPINAAKQAIANTIPGT